MCWLCLGCTRACRFSGGISWSESGGQSEVTTCPVFAVNAAGFPWAIVRKASSDCELEKFTVVSYQLTVRSKPLMTES